MTRQTWGLMSSSDWAAYKAGKVIKTPHSLYPVPLYYPRLGSPFVLPDSIAYDGLRFPTPDIAVSWFTDMVRRAETLTRRRLWSKAMQKRAKLVADAQDKALADWKEAGNDG